MDDSCDRLKTRRDGYVLMETGKRGGALGWCLGVVPWGGALGWCLGVVPWGGALGWCLGVVPWGGALGWCLGVVPWGGALGWCLGVVPWGGALGWCLAPLHGTFVPFAPLPIGLLFISLLLHVYTIICIYIFSFCKINKAVKSKRQRGNSLRQSGGGGGKGPLSGDRVCLFKTAASCLYDPLGRKLRVTAVTTIWKHA